MRKCISILVLALLVPFGQVWAHDDGIGRAEFAEIMRELVALRMEVQHLRMLMAGEGSGAIPAPDYVSNKWGCYLDDLSAGGLYSTGATEGEAKGRLLEKCKQKDGSCWAHKVVCTKEE